MFPSGSFNNFSDAVIKENLFRRLGTVLHSPTRKGLIQTVFSTANAAIVDEATAFPEDNDTFDKASFSSYKIPPASIVCRKGFCAFFLFFRQRQHQPIQRRFLADSAALDVKIRVHAERQLLFQLRQTTVF